MAIWTNEGLKDRMRYLLGITNAYGLTVRLFTNNVSPTVGNVAADFVECALPGYAAQALAPGNWTESVAGGVETANYPVLTFTFLPNGGGVTVYGFVVTNPNTGKSAFAEEFLTPYLVPAAGGQLTLGLTQLVFNA